MQILRPQPRPTEPGTLGTGPALGMPAPRGTLMWAQDAQVGEREQDTPSASLPPSHLSLGNFRTFQSLVQSSIRQSTSLRAGRSS